MDLGHLLSGLSRSDDPNLLVGFETSDDAGVYRIGDAMALVQTVDLITPVCDDPYLFGQIAAANAISDVYAMGGRPLTALNVCCFPGEGIPDGVLAAILRGGLDKLKEAGAVLLGGHTVKDSEMKYGMAVTGLIDPSRLLRNAGAAPGDALVLTKPIGTGLMITAAKKQMLAAERIAELGSTMAALNAEAGRLALQYGASACTDITGFGLAGHALEVARASGAGLRLRMPTIPRYDECLGLIEKGIKTGVTASNRQLAGDQIRFASGISETEQQIFFDPQTSGGLLISLPPVGATALVAALRAGAAPETSIIGEVFATASPVLEVLPC